jgi:hypothetical protein
MCGILGLSLLGCAPRTNMTVMIKMIDAQEAYFREEVLEGFEKQEKADLEVVRFPNVDSIEQALDGYRGEVSLLKVPFDKGWSLAHRGLIKPLNSFLTDDELDEFSETYLLTSLGQRNGQQYYVPRKFETRIMVYRKSKVIDAVAVWRKHREAIDAEMKKYNGYGLPATYLLEENPNEWDFFDVFVVGWIWAHTPYEGTTAPRVAHRGKRYSGTGLRLIDRAFQCGADSAAILTLSGNGVIDSYHWEAVYAAAGVLNPRMWEEEWSGSGVWQGFKEGEVFLSFMTQLDCFFIHGTGRDGLTGYLDDPEDMGVAVMPRGCSVELDSKGTVVRKGSRAITTGGWWWGVPAEAPDPRASYRLARHITSTENQIQGCSRFGMIPVRKEILSDISMLFGGGWVSSIYDVSFRQLMHNKYTVLPYSPNFDKIRDLYIGAWFDIVARGNWSQDRGVPSRAHIAYLLKNKYAAKVSMLR